MTKQDPFGKMVCAYQIALQQLHDDEYNLLFGSSGVSSFSLELKTLMTGFFGDHRVTRPAGITGLLGAQIGRGSA